MKLAEHAVAGNDRLRRAIALRAMLATGSTPSVVADVLCLPRHEVDRLVQQAPGLSAIHPSTLIDAAAPVLRALAAMHGYERIAVFGSVGRGDASAESDIDLIVQPPAGASSFDFVRFKGVLEQTLGRPVDVVSYGALKSGTDDDILRDAKLL